jgi:hypothetical protein
MPACKAPFADFFSDWQRISQARQVGKSHMVWLNVSQKIVDFENQNLLLLLADAEHPLQKFLELSINKEPLYDIASQSHHSRARGKQANSVNVAQQLAHEGYKDTVADDKQVSQAAVVSKGGDQFTHSKCDHLQVIDDYNVPLFQCFGIKRFPNKLLHFGQRPTLLVWTNGPVF